MIEVIKKEKVNNLIDVLIHSGGGKSQYGKLNEIVKTYTTENSLVRNTLLIWLDSMGIMNVDKQNQYNFNKPIWIKSSIENHYILYGALTKTEIKKLELNTSVKKYINNKINYKNFIIELPDTYYTSDAEVLDEHDYSVINSPIFFGIENMTGLSNVEANLFKGNIAEITISNGGISNDIDGYKFVLDAEQTVLFVYPQDDVKQFNWRTRDYIKCDLINELNIDKNEEGLKLIKITKSYEGNHKENFTFLLEKEANKAWEYKYFDKKNIDERWARYLFIDKLEYYDIEKDFKGMDDKAKGWVAQNAIGAMGNNFEFITQCPISNNFFKIPNVLRKQLVQYDSRQGLMAFPLKMPLPKEIMRYLFTCSGVVPQVFKNKFVMNPDYNIKRLFSGVLSPNGQNVPYPDQQYFKQEDYYLFTYIPTELAEKIFEKLNLDMNLDIFKRTFLQKV
jgi:hypothetical protein